MESTYDAQAWPITIRMRSDGWVAILDHPALGEIVIAQDRTDHRVHMKAARFVETNFPELHCYFVDYAGWPDTNTGYHSGYWQDTI